MSRRNTRNPMNSDGSEDSVEQRNSENRKPQSMDTETVMIGTPKSVKASNEKLSRSGRKLTPTRVPNFIYENSSKVLQSQEKRRQQVALAASRRNKVNESPVDPDGNEESDTHEVSTEFPEPNDDVLCADNGDVAGEHLYLFRTPKKRNALAPSNINHLMATPTTPASALQMLSLNSPRTPQTPASKMRTLSLNNQRTPKTTRNDSTQMSTKTPHRERSKLQKEMKKRLGEISDEESDVSDDLDANYVASESDSESDTDDSASETEDIRMQPAKANKMLKNVRVTNEPIVIESDRSARLRRRKQLADPDFLPQSDNYFSAASTKKVKTSDHTLDKLKSSGLRHDDMFALLRTVEMSAEHRMATTEMLQEHSQNFATWMLQLSKGFNIIIYGIGSKQCVLQQFCETYPARPYIIVNGFFPTLTVKDILNEIRTGIETMNANARTDHEIVDDIAVAFQRSPQTHLFLVIHNIDGPMLRKSKDQHILSRLAKIPNVHFLASVDHINAPLMWDQTCLSNYNFVWYDCTTMLPYTNETAFENSIFLQSSGELNLAAMNNVFQSLTSNARGVYMLLIELYMKNKNDANYQGMPFKDLYHACRERFLVSSDVALRTQLIEFVDHHMAKTRRGIDGTEHVAIPIDVHILEQFIETQKD